MSLPPLVLKSLAAALLLAAGFLALHPRREPSPETFSRAAAPPSSPSLSSSLLPPGKTSRLPSPSHLSSRETAASPLPSSSPALSTPASLRAPRPASVAARRSPSATADIPTSPGLPGDLMTSGGNTIEVVAVTPTPQGPVPRVDITPAPSASSASRAGLTEQQELFRTKWGWNAYDRALRTAAGESPQLR